MATERLNSVELRCTYCGSTENLQEDGYDDEQYYICDFCELLNSYRKPPGWKYYYRKYKRRLLHPLTYKQIERRSLENVNKIMQEIYSTNLVEQIYSESVIMKRLKK